MAKFIIFLILSGCAHDFPAAVCAEYGGIRRISKNFVFCNNAMVYNKNEGYFIRRGDDSDIPETQPQEPSDSLKNQ